MSYVIFFFQAEDGIRDLTVTGVQTCALPVVRTAAFALVAAFGAFGRSLGALGRSLGPLGGAFAILGGRRRGRGFASGYFFRGLFGGRGRSGERRVGEEGRSRGAPCHLKKKKKITPAASLTIEHKYITIPIFRNLQSTLYMTLSAQKVAPPYMDLLPLPLSSTPPLRYY